MAGARFEEVAIKRKTLIKYNAFSRAEVREQRRVDGNKKTVTIFGISCLFNCNKKNAIILNILCR